MLTDNELLSRLADLSKTQAKAECEILAYLIEVSRRELHLKKAYRSLFEFIRVFLKCSEATASRRVAVVHAARKFPFILEMIQTQTATLTSLAIVAPHLTHENCESILKRIAGASKREAETLVSTLSPTKPKRDMIRPITIDVPKNDLTSEGKDEKMFTSDFTETPFSLGAQETQTTKTKVRMAFDAPAELAEKIERLKEIHAHKLKDGSLAEVLEMAVDMLLERTAPEREVKDSATKASAREVKKSPRAQREESRRPPATIRREVWKRDGGQCTFTDEHGKRCTAKSYLQIDHLRPWAWGGSSRDAENLRILCRAHNLLMARKYFPAQLSRHAPIH